MSVAVQISGWNEIEASAFDGLRLRGSVVTIGVFDGLHRGHQRLLSAAERLARSAGHARLHVGFDPHPDLLLRGSLPLQLLDEIELTLRFTEAGVSHLLSLSFDATMRETPWVQFIERLVAASGAKSLVLSPESALGQGREGTLPRLRAWGAAHGVQVHPVSEARSGGTAISSTRIRAAIAAGELALAARMLGRPHALVGTLFGSTLHVDGGGGHYAFPPAGEYRLRLGHAAHLKGRLPLAGRPTTGKLDPIAGTIELPPRVLRGAPTGVGREGESFVEGTRLRAALLAGRSSS